MDKKTLVDRIDQLLKTEVLKQDLFFMCGAPTDKPNTSVIKVCKAYLNGEEGAKEEMKKVFEEAVAIESKITNSRDNLMDSAKDMQLILDNMDLL